MQVSKLKSVAPLLLSNLWESLDRNLEIPKEKNVLGTIWLQLLAEENVEEAFKILDKLEALADKTIRTVTNDLLTQVQELTPEQMERIFAEKDSARFK